jgi:hypothetical protein
VSHQPKAAGYAYHFGTPEFFTGWDRDGGPSLIRWLTIKELCGAGFRLVGLFCTHERSSYFFPRGIKRKFLKGENECGFLCPQCNSPVREELWNCQSAGCAIAWACHCSVLGIDEQERFEQWIAERWMWMHANALGQARPERLWDSSLHVLRKQFWLEMIGRYRGFVRRHGEQNEPTPEWVKSRVREIAAQHPELMEAVMDDPAEPSVGMLPPDVCLLVKEYLETHPESTIGEMANGVIAVHGQAWMANKEASQRLALMALLSIMRRMIEEGEL